MNKLACSQQTYLQSSQAQQLASLANHLKQIATICTDATDLSAAVEIIRESQYFIEWAAPTLQIDDAAELVNLGRVLAGWKFRWIEISSNPASLLDVHNSALAWYKQLLRQK